MDNQASILVVDDDPENFEVVSMLLFRDSYALTYIASGIEALQFLEQQQPDVILLDVMMPDLDGIEVCRQIKANPHWQHIPVIMVTALNSKEDLAHCLDAGADDFVGKPVNGLELRARVRSMLRLKQQYDALQTMLQLREDISNMIVHDLRNPLGSIVMACNLLQMSDLQEKQQRKVGQIMIAGQQLEALIDSLLLMAKLESGKFVLNRNEIDVKAMGQSALVDFEAIASQKNINLVGKFEDVDCWTSADGLVLRRVIDNLLSNAIKFSPSGSQVTLSVESLNQQGIRIQVMDTGFGVSPELRQSIFEKYETGKLVQGVSQTGLGLAFCKMAVVAHGGTISVEDNYPKGTVFTVEL